MKGFYGMTNEERAAYREQEREERAAERTKMEAEFGTADMPEKARDLIWNKAWEDGHSSGYGEVRMHYDDLADIAKAAVGDGPPITGDQMAAYLDHVAALAGKADAEKGNADRFIIEGGRAFAYNAAGDFVSTRTRERESKADLIFRLQAGMFVGVSEHG